MNAAQTRLLVRFLAVAIPTLAGATIVVAVLQDGFGVANPSAVYLIAVVATAIATGTAGAIAASFASFLLYDYLFTEPRYTLSVAEPSVWISTALLLFVGVVVGQLAAMQRSRADEAAARERDARSLFSVSRALATRESIEAAVTEIARVLREGAGFDEVAISPAGGDTTPPVVEGRVRPDVINQLRRLPEPRQYEWVRTHVPTGRPRNKANEDIQVFRVPIETYSGALGSIWAVRPRSAGVPTHDETRLLAVAADQLGQALAHDRLAADAREAEVARASDTLKSALLQSVSHDLRTPLATIRAAAGTLRPDSGADGHARSDSVNAIDREVDYLNRLVTNLLDLSRIEAGVLRAEPEPFELQDLVEATLRHLEPRLQSIILETNIGDQLVLADPVFFDEVVTNVIDNAVRHGGIGVSVRISATTGDDGSVTLTIEDSGDGVADEVLPRLFDKFFRVPGRRPTRTGTGIGLAVARGLTEAMAGSIHARRSELGGLAIDIDLPAATRPTDAARTGVEAAAS